MSYVIKLHKNNKNLMLAEFGKNNTTILDKVCAFLLAISPLLQHYKGPLFNCGITILVLVFSYLFLKLLTFQKFRRMRLGELMPVIPLVFFSIYKVVNHGTTIVEVLEYFIIIIIYVVAAIGCVNIYYVMKTATMISCLASVCLIIQYFCFYFLGFHLRLVPVSLLLPSSQQWVGGAMTGLISITGRRGNLYRPSAFFLEPSHMFLYCFPIIIMLLFSKNESQYKKRLAVLITVGMMLSTSGMGIFVGAGIWLLYFAIKKKDTFSFKNIFRAKNVILFMVIAIIFVVIYYNVPFIQQAVNRVFIQNKGGATAISGRTASGMQLIKNMKGASVIFGCSDSVGGIEYNLSGFVSTMYKYGIVGIVISYSFYFMGILRLKNGFFYINIIIIIVSFFSAHTHSIFIGMYYTFILLEGYHDSRVNKATERREELGENN